MFSFTSSSQSISRISLTFQLTLAFAGGAIAAVIHVPADQPTIRAGVDAAGNVDTVMLAPGTYTGDGNRDVLIEGKAVSIIGAGPESTVIDCEASQSNQYRAFQIHNTSGINELRGLTIRKAYKNKLGIIDSAAGSAVYCKNSDLIIGNCVFDSCLSMWGGSIFADSSTLVVDSSDFLDLPSLTIRTAGGAIFSSNSELIVSASNFMGGVVGSTGGAIFSDNCSVTVSECMFENFYVFGEFGDAGGAMFGRMSVLSLESSIFRNNSSLGSNSAGGAVACVDSSTIIVTSCNFENNYAPLGGAISIRENSIGEVESSTLKFNVAGFGGGIFATHSELQIGESLLSQCVANNGNGGAVYLWEITNGQIDYSVFQANSAIDSGSGLYALTSDIILNGCTFKSNSASAFSATIHFADSVSAEVQNCIISHSTSGVGIKIAGIDGDCYIECSDVFANNNGDWVGAIASQANINGNFSLDPKFCDTASGSVSLHENSPCRPENNSCGVLIGASDSTCLATDVAEEDSPAPGSFILSQNYPNPFNPSTEIAFTLPRKSDVTVTIHNVLGQTVRTLAQGVLSAGEYRVTWDGRNTDGAECASGVYFYTLKSGEFTQTKKMTLVR